VPTSIVPGILSIEEGMSGEANGGVADVARQINDLGAKHFILSSDFGVYTLPTPLEGRQMFVACMLDLSICPDHIR